MCSNANDLSDYESEGRGFESLPAHQEKQRLNVMFVVAFLFMLGYT